MREVFHNLGENDNIKEVVSNENCTIIKLQNETGEGLMTIYDVFPGVVIMYNDFHMSYCKSGFQTSREDFVCIDHCREGCLENIIDDGYSYSMEAGDLDVDIRKRHIGKYIYPLNHFHGVSIGFYLPVAEKQLSEELKGFPVKLSKLQEKFCKEELPMVIKSSPEIEHIFSEIYRVPAKIMKEYFRIKIFELLLFLDALEFEESKEEKAYFYKSKVEKVREIHALITEDFNTHYTIEELSKRFDISQTALKSCFKNLYGDAINSYLQTYKINTAASLLRKNKEMSVADIAGYVGYDSQSKFTSVFKKIIGVTPMEYRKSERKEEV